MIKLNLNHSQIVQGPGIGHEYTQHTKEPPIYQYYLASIAQYRNTGIVWNLAEKCYCK